MASAHIMQAKLNHRHVLCFLMIGLLSLAPSILSAETFQEYLIRTTQVPSGQCTRFNLRPKEKNRRLSVSIEQVGGKRPDLISLHNFITEFNSDDYQVVLAIGPSELPDLLSGEKVKGCAIRVSVGSDEHGAWQIRSSDSFIKLETQDISFEGKTDGSKPITIRIGDSRFIVSIREVPI
jgi:hypothetical protein